MTVHSRKTMVSDIITGLDAVATGTYLKLMKATDGNIQQGVRDIDYIRSVEFGNLNMHIDVMLGDCRSMFNTVAILNQEVEQDIIIIVEVVGDSGVTDFNIAVDLSEEVEQAVVKLGDLATGGENLIRTAAWEPQSFARGDYGQMHVVTMVFTYRKTGALGA